MTKSAPSNSNIEAIYPMSPMQQGLLFQTLYSKSSQYFQQLSQTLRGDLNVEALKRAWERVVERHSVLRTLFIWERRDKPLQVARKYVALPWKQYDWRGLSPAEQEDRLEAFLHADRELGFELSKAPLMRLTLIQLADDVYQFVWSHHHLLMDGWSGALVRNEVYAFYESFYQGRELNLRPPHAYKEYISWLQRQDLSQAETFWRDMLKGFTTPTPIAPPRAREGTATQKVDYDACGLILSEEVTATLQFVARRHQLTMNTVIQGAWALLLNYYTGEKDVIFGSVVSGRPPELEGVETMVGVFINTLPVRMQLSLDQPLASWLKKHQARQFAMQQYEYSPLVDVQGWSEVPRGQPLFDSILVFQSYPQDFLISKGKSALEVLNPRASIRNNYPLTLRAIPGAGLQLQLLYDCHRFDFHSVLLMLRNLDALIHRMIEQPESTLSDLLAAIEESDKRQRVVKEEEFKEARRQRLKTIKRKAIV